MTKWIKCPYCVVTTEPVNLSAHIKKVHDKKVWYEWVDKNLEKVAYSENFDNIVDEK